MDLEAVKWYRMAAEHGDANAQFNLGEYFMYGRGVARNQGEAVKWYHKAAEQGHVNARREFERHTGRPFTATPK
jgi:TPR repeat protein